MRILFVTPYVPSLIRVRPYNFIKHLSKRHSITLVCLTQGDQAEDESLEVMKRHCDGVVSLALSKARSISNCCRRLLSSMPLQAAYTCASDISNTISQLAKTRSFDVLHVEHIRGAHLAEGVTHIPRVFDSVDCITRLLKSRLAHQQGAIQRALHYEELLKMRMYEPRVAAGFDRVVVTSRHDKKALEALIRRLGQYGDSAFDADLLARVDEFGAQDNGKTLGKRDWLTVVPNGVDTDYFHPMPLETRSNTVVFSGRMSYFPNVSAVLWFYSEVFPRIKANRPDAKFKIIGSDPPDSIRKLEQDPAVQVTGYVSDLRPYIATAGVVACPLMVGVGIQNKVLEAMAMGKPVVASSVACKGIPDAVSGTHLVRADEPGQMAEVILGLMNSPENACRLGDRARRFVVESYSWDTAVRELEEIYLQATEMARYRVPMAA